MTNAHEVYLKKLSNYRKIIKMTRGLVLILFLSIWELAARLDLIDEFFFSSPMGITKWYYKAITTGELFTHIGCTLFETILSFFLVMFFSIMIASILWFSKPLADIFEPSLVILNSLPKSALAPLIIVWLGTGTKTIVIAGISVAVFGSVINLFTQFKQTDEEREKLIITLGGSRLDVYKKIVLPYSVPTLINLMKVNIGLSLVGVIIGEFLAARKGLGYLIIYGTQVFKLDMVISAIILLCFIAYGLYFLIQILERHIPFMMEE
ncbi:MAG: ABC transporter permease [Lachnospiraceae bacterium]|nr:ABC transporter permease [Lachnospiraceae bacterium]